MTIRRVTTQPGTANDVSRRDASVYVQRHDRIVGLAGVIEI